jgi:CBS domain-containing protein
MAIVCIDDQARAVEIRDRVIIRLPDNPSGGKKMQVNEVMTTNPTCCIPSDTAQTAAIIMRDEDTGIVPIVERKGSPKVIGVVTDRDLCIGVLAETPTGTEGLSPANVPVERCMTRQVVFCKANDDLDKVLDLMQENQVRRILVVDGQDTLLGVVSMADLMNRGKVSKGETTETLKRISEPTDEASKPRAQTVKLSKSQ